MNLPLPGFGFPTVLRQLAHTIGAEVYWQTVVTRGYSEEARMPALPDVAAIEAFREQTASVTRSYLEGASEAALNTPRVVTHIFNHQGQVLAMCRHALIRAVSSEPVASARRSRRPRDQPVNRLRQDQMKGLSFA